MSADYYQVQFRPRSIVAYPVYCFEKRRNAVEDGKRHDLTNESNTTKGLLSNNSIRRLRYAVNLLEECTPWQLVTNPTTQTQYQFKLGFLTLTLPCAQGNISDETIKRDALNQFLDSLQKKVGKFSYIWKAEVQENGNIHFHLTINKWIHFSTLRHYWNKQLKRLGYIDEYKRNQENFHSKGFRARPELFNTWPEDAQRKAYEFGVISNWSEPNTIDIHSVRNIKDLSAYLIKYMSKKEEGKRAIKGKIWGCSKNLTYNNKFERPDMQLEQDELKHWSQDFDEIPLEIDFIHCYRMDKKQFKKTFKLSLQAEYAQFLKDIYNFEHGISSV